MDDVVKHNVYFDCADDDAALASFMDELNRVRLEYFSDPGPTTTESRVGLDREGALIQVEAVAALGVEKQRLMPAGHWNWDQPLPFSHGWKVGDMVFVGGQRSLDHNGQVLGIGDIAAQTRTAFGGLEAMFKEAGGDIGTMQRQNTYYRFLGEGRDVTDYWERMTRVRMEFMANPSACGTGVRIAGFPRADELIQVEGIGVLGANKQRLMPANHWDWSLHNNQFSQGWRVGDLVFVGGQISADADARTVGDDIATQTRNVFEFIRNTLREAGADEERRGQDQQLLQRRRGLVADRRDRRHRRRHPGRILSRSGSGLGRGAGDRFRVRGPAGRNRGDRRARSLIAPSDTGGVALVEQHHRTVHGASVRARQEQRRAGHVVGLRMGPPTRRPRGDELDIVAVLGPGSELLVAGCRRVAGGDRVDVDAVVAPVPGPAPW